MASEKRSPLEDLDSLFGGVADVIGADRPESFSRDLSEESRRALDHLLSLVGEWRVDHTLNTSGMVLVAVDDGVRMLVLDTATLEGKEWINLAVYLLRDLPEDDRVRTRVRRTLEECNLYYGVKFVLLDNEIRAMIDIPACGTNSEALLTAATRLLWVIADAADDLDSIGAGRPVDGWNALGLPISQALMTPSG